MKNNYLSKAIQIMSMVVLIMACTVNVHANGLMNNVLYTGTAQLIADATAIGTLLCPAVCGLAALIFSARKGMADEQDGKMWTKRMTNAIIFGVAGGLISGVISLIASYYAGG